MGSRFGRGAGRAIINGAVVGSYVPPGVPACAIKAKSRDVLLRDEDRSPIPEVAVNDNAEEWFAVVVRPGYEIRFAEALGRAGVRHYRPVYTTWGKHPEGRQEIERSLFPRYVFVANPNWFDVTRADGFAGVVYANGIPAQVPTADVAEIAAQQLARAHDVRGKAEPAAAPLAVDLLGKRVRAVTSKGVDMLKEFLGRGSVAMPANMEVVG